jgi:hypothetical protein
MDARSFDSLIKTLRTRRSALSLMAGIGVFLGLRNDEAAAKKCKKKCGPCKRCKKGKCKPKSGAPRCGPCSVCERGVCRQRCRQEECFDIGGQEVCEKECVPPCNTCSRCNISLGQCEPLCHEADCSGGFCRFQCDSPCGDCSVCELGDEGGECFDLCPGVDCVDNLCRTPCSPDCLADEECIGGECFPVCEPSCNDDQGCVARGGSNLCVNLAGNCPAGPHDACHVTGGLACSVDGGGGGLCATLPTGGTYCAKGNVCTSCESDLDCQGQGYGPNSRCVSDCPSCASNGGVGCVRFGGESD